MGQMVVIGWHSFERMDEPTLRFQQQRCVLASHIDATHFKPFQGLNVVGAGTATIRRPPNGGSGRVLHIFVILGPTRFGSTMLRVKLRWGGLGVIDPIDPHLKHL